jgi:hypothetical protein
MCGCFCKVEKIPDRICAYCGLPATEFWVLHTTGFCRAACAEHSEWHRLAFRRSALGMTGKGTRWCRMTFDESDVVKVTAA